MWQSHRSSGIGRQNLEAGILLAHYAQRCDRTGQKVQSVPGACQGLSSPFGAADVSYQPLALSTVGIGHLGTPTHRRGPMQVCHRGSGLFHQMGRGRTSSNNHRTKGTQFCLALHNMQIWYPKSPGVRQ